MKIPDGINREDFAGLMLKALNGDKPTSEDFAKLKEIYESYLNAYEKDSIQYLSVVASLARLETAIPEVQVIFDDSDAWKKTTETIASIFIDGTTHAGMTEREVNPLLECISDISSYAYLQGYKYGKEEKNPT